jgi:uncharacterized RmlC-like cupin family protein
MHRPSFSTLYALAGTVFSPPDAVPSEVITVRPGEAAAAKQGFSYFQGISRENAGASGLCLYKVVIPPGGSAQAHFHKDHETAVYLLEGRVETFYGESLARSVVNGPGDFIYIPAGMPHKPVNLSVTEVAIAIVARTDPNEQEGIVPVEEPEHLRRR